MTKGQRDYSGVQLATHAVERFMERFWTGNPSEFEAAELALRSALQHSRRLGRNARNEAIAALANLGDRMLIAIIQGSTCTTVLTWPQFEPRMHEFGRTRLPRKPKRMMRRLRGV